MTNQWSTDLTKLIEAENARAGAQLLHCLSWSMEDFLKLPDSAYQMELLDGSLLMLAGPTSDHHEAVFNLTLLLMAAAPKGWHAAFRCGLKLGPATLLQPDVMVVTCADPPDYYAPDETALVAEIESPGSLHVDRILKPGLYAEAGIDWYLRIELERSGSSSPVVTLYRLENGAYVEHRRASAGQVLHLTEPVEVSFDPALLLDEDCFSQLEDRLKARRQTSG